MKRFSRLPILLSVLYAAVCGATAWSVGDDAVDGPAEPLPLFSPPDSVRPLQGPGGVSRGANVESKEELYERLRQSLLNLEHRLQEGEQRVEAESDPHTESPATQTPQGEHANTAPHVQSDDPDPTEPLFSPMSPDPPHASGSTHVDVPQPSLPETVEIPHEAESTHVTEAPHTEAPHTEAPHTEEAGHGAETPHVSHSPAASGSALISPEAMGSPNLPALADNLYALGEYQLAHGSYLEIDRASLSEEDKLWVSYQLAGCLRHMGDTDSAASAYRQILAGHPDHYLAGISRWWLDAMEEYSEQTQALDVLRATLQRMNEARDVHAVP